MMRVNDASHDSDLPMISVVIPTYNRQARLHRVLNALAAQTTDAAFEVVVVSDGSTDGTDEYLRSDLVPIPVAASSQANSGPAAARNAGVRIASAPLVLFLDDDVIPAPDLIERHWLAHEAADDDIVVIGPMLTPQDVRLSPWVAWEQHQLYKQYEAMRVGDYQPTFRQFYTGNASVSRQRVLDVGGFDTRFRRAEDVELAFRLHQSGLRFEFVAEAKGHHYAERSFEAWLKTPFEYGRNDVAFMEAGQTWMTRSLPSEFRDRHPLVRALTRLCIPRPRLARAADAALRRVADSRLPVETLRRHALSGLYNLAYYRGLADALGSPERFFELMSGDAPDMAATSTGALDAVRRPRVTFVLEQTLGHVTHSDNLRSLLAAEPRADVSFLPVPYEVNGVAAKIPGFGNWTVRAGLRARRLIRSQYRRTGIDAMFIHTQVPAVFVGGWMRRIPTIVSLDATPAQYDQLGEFYAHQTSSARTERWKKLVNTRCYQRAAHVVAWSSWTRDGLVAEYGIDHDSISVIAPGVDVERWRRRDVVPDASPVQILFVGGDLERKGGRLLLEAAAILRADPGVPAFQLHLVTRTPVDDPDVIVHADMTPNSPELIALYHRSHVFCLPTFGDCLPMVLSEAGVAEMALVSTDVGAISEIVRDGSTGLLIPPGDLDALVGALKRLIIDPDLRRALGGQARDLVMREYDARINADRVIDLLLRTRSQ